MSLLYLMQFVSDIESANEVFYLFFVLAIPRHCDELPYLSRHVTHNKMCSVFPSLLIRLSHGNFVTYAIASKL
jgi:hypothetical protein